MFRLLLALLLSWIPSFGFSQSPSVRIVKVNAENYCTGTDLAIDVTISGTFPPDNKFSVVVHRDWDSSAEVWTYPAELTGNRIVANLKDPGLAKYERVVLKLVSSNPKTETENVPFRVTSKSRLQFATKAGLAADTVNSVDPVELALTVSPPSSGQVTLNTGEKFELINPIYGGESYTTNIRLPVAKEGTYSVKEAVNICGAMQVSGEVAVKLNAIDFFPTSVYPHTVCEGGEFKVVFGTNGQEFAAGTQFRIRLYRGDEYIARPEFADVPAELTGKNELTARFPEHFKVQNFSEQFRIGILAANPASVSRNDALKIWVSPKPGFALTTRNPAVAVGEPVQIDVAFTGMYSYTLTFTNGLKITSSTSSIHARVPDTRSKHLNRAAESSKTRRISR